MSHFFPKSIQFRTPVMRNFSHNNPTFCSYKGIFVYCTKYLYVWRIFFRGYFLQIIYYKEGGSKILLVIQTFELLVMEVQVTGFVKVDCRCKSKDPKQGRRSRYLWSRTLDLRHFKTNQYQLIIDVSLVLQLFIES